MFEEYEFRSYFRCTPASLISHGPLFAQHNLPPPECLLIVDSGFSFTHVVPVLNGDVVWAAVKRIDVGGKLLTNHLKETVSFRQWNMMEETHIMNEIKEACCFVSEDFAVDLETCRARPTANPIVQEYIFPDYSARRPGRIRNPGESLDESTQQTLRMANERFSVPEILFHPTNIGKYHSHAVYCVRTLAHPDFHLGGHPAGYFLTQVSTRQGSAQRWRRA